ncbi:hypothetical protein MMC16_006823 [Acarospora aff. strigata]|nr:hypothetical protein [Acarospora aff. strigata]
MKGSFSIVLMSLVGTLSSTVYGNVLPRTTKPKPVIPGNFADPSIIGVGNTWYAFATNDRGSAKDHRGPNVQISTSADFKKWSTPDVKKDALPDAGCWTYKGKEADKKASVSDGPDVWAPHVVELPNPKNFRESQFVMYYSARSAEGGHPLCISAAVSTKIEGPYLPRSQPIACHPKEGGAIHPAGFRDSDGKLYVVYKVDGNAKGNGGVCNNSKDPIKPTPIMLQGLRDDGVTPVAGDLFQLLDRDNRHNNDGPLVEAPSLVKRDGTYFLFFSSQCSFDANYDTSYATSKKLCGEYKKTDKPLLVAGGDLGLVGPGSSMIIPNGTLIAFHAQVEQKRSMFVGSLSYNGDRVTVKVEGS